MDVCVIAKPEDLHDIITDTVATMRLTSSSSLVDNKEILILTLYYESLIGLRYDDYLLQCKLKHLIITASQKNTSYCKFYILKVL